MPDPTEQLDRFYDHLSHANGIGLDEAVARDYRKDVPKLLAAVESVLGLHKPGTVMPSRSGLPQCVECSDADSHGPVPWPCSTVRAITDALNGDTDD